MADDVLTPRSRGSLCGLALILLGAWAALAPFIGPSLRFGFTPDRAWEYTSGRVYLSALPGALVLLVGLIVAMTRSRSFGGFCALVAALGGAWLIAGAALVKLLLPASQAAGITAGTPIGASSSVQVLTRLAFFTGTGALIVFFAAVALGRFSITALKDYVGPAADTGDGTGMVGAGAYQVGHDASTQQVGQPQYGSQYPSGRDPFPPSQYPATEQYPTAGGQYQQQGPFGLTSGTTLPGQYQQSASPFPPAQYPGYSGQTSSESTTAIERPPGQDPSGPTP